MPKQRKISEVTTGQGTRNTVQQPSKMDTSRVDELAKKVAVERKAASQRAAGLAEPGTTEIP